VNLRWIGSAFLQERIVLDRLPQLPLGSRDDRSGESELGQDSIFDLFRQVRGRVFVCLEDYVSALDVRRDLLEAKLFKQSPQPLHRHSLVSTHIDAAQHGDVSRHN